MGFYALDPRELMWHDAHTWRSHEGRHEPTWAPTWCEDANEAKSIGPTGIVGPGKRIGDVTIYAIVENTQTSVKKKFIILNSQ